MIELLEVRPDDLSGDLASAVHRLLRDAFPKVGPNEGDYYCKLGPPEVAIVLRDGPQVFGHLGLYTREVEIGNETLEIGMLRAIVVAPDRRRRGYGRLLVRRAHEHLKERRKLMQSAMHFTWPDGIPMYAELSQRRWPPTRAEALTIGSS